MYTLYKILQATPGGRNARRGDSGRFLGPSGRENKGDKKGSPPIAEKSGVIDPAVYDFATDPEDTQPVFRRDLSKPGKHRMHMEARSYTDSGVLKSWFVPSTKKEPRGTNPQGG